MRSGAGTFSILVDDDGPIGGAVTLQSVDEEGIAGGNIGDSYASGDLAGAALTATASLNISWGADDADDDALNGATGDRIVVFNAAQPGLAGFSSNGSAVSITLLANGTLVGYTGAVVPTTIGSAGVVFHASLNDDASGSYTFTAMTDDGVGSSSTATRSSTTGATWRPPATRPSSLSRPDGISFGWTTTRTWAGP